MALIFEGAASPKAWDGGYRYDVYYRLKRGLGAYDRTPNTPEMGHFYELRVYDGWVYARKIDSVVVTGGWAAVPWEQTSLPLKHPIGAPGAPELPAECWRDLYGMHRNGVDFAAITRLIAEGSKHAKKD